VVWGDPKKSSQRIPLGIILKEQVRSLEEALRIKEKYAWSR